MSDEISELTAVVRAQLPASDPVTVSVVTAVCGLLAAIAYADREHSEAERHEIEVQLTRVEGLGEIEAAAIVKVTERHQVAFSTTFVARFARTLREQTDTSMRRQVLDVLLSVAAADGKISHDEVVSLRNLTTSLGLSQSDYNELQSKYRELLYFN